MEQGMRRGNLWHMTIAQLQDFMECKGIPLIAPGRGSNRVQGPKYGQPVKRDYIQRIEEALGYRLPTTRQRGVERAAGNLYRSRLDLTVPIMQQRWGGDTDIEACIGTSLPKDCLLEHGFVEKEEVRIPNEDRLWSTVVGYTLARTACTISAWHGAEDTLIVQNLGTDPNVVDMWTVSMNRRPNPPRWSDSTARTAYEPIVVKDRWTCEGENGHVYAFCLVQGLWRIGLETLFSEALPASSAESYPAISLVGKIVEKVTNFTHSTSCAGRDTQHYAWRFEKDTYGNPWLILSLLPLPYLYNSEEEFTKVPADKLVRSALDGVGGMYLTTMIKN